MLLQDLLGDNCDIETISGGCDCDTHQRRMRTKLISLAMQGFDRVLVEPSGIFDVDEFYDVLRDEPLDRWYTLGNVIAIVDALLETQLSPQGEYLLASEAASAGMVLMSRCQLAAPGQAEETLAHLNRALEACHCTRRFAADTDALCKPWDALTDADMQRLDSCGHCQASYVKLHFDEHKAFTSLYFMELHLTLPQLQDAARALFADPACGHILRIKGFLQTADSWCELNATRDTMHVEAIPDGQEVLIIIGEELDRSAIEAHIGQKTADQE